MGGPRSESSRKVRHDRLNTFRHVKPKQKAHQLKVGTTYSLQWLRETRSSLKPCIARISRTEDDSQDCLTIVTTKRSKVGTTEELVLWDNQSNHSVASTRLQNRIGDFRLRLVFFRVYYNSWLPIRVSRMTKSTSHNKSCLHRAHWFKFAHCTAAKALKFCSNSQNP